MTSDSGAGGTVFGVGFRLRLEWTFGERFGRFWLWPMGTPFLVPMTETGVPRGTFWKNQSAILAGRRMQPWEAG